MKSELVERLRGESLAQTPLGFDSDLHTDVLSHRLVVRGWQQDAGLSELISDCLQRFLAAGLFLALCGWLCLFVVGWLVVKSRDVLLCVLDCATLGEMAGYSLPYCFNVLDRFRDGWSELNFKFFGADTEIATVKLDLGDKLPRFITRPVACVDFSQQIDP